MSASVLLFTPAARNSAAENLELLIEICRASEVLQAHLNFEDDAWEHGYAKGSSTRIRTYFTCLGASGRPDNNTPMPEPFKGFAKALIIYMHDKSPLVNQWVRITAMRFLCLALTTKAGHARPWDIDAVILDRAVELARSTLNEMSAYQVGNAVAYIARTAAQLKLIFLRGGWHHGVEKPEEHGSRISKKAEEDRLKKLPSAAALRAIGGIFSIASAANHLIVASYLALLLCAPDRINEVLRLAIKCLCDGDGEFAGRLGIRMPGSKGFQDAIKWIPWEMTWVARQAVSNLITLSKEARAIAQWYTINPTSIYLRDEIAHLRQKEIVDLREIASILWGNENSVTANLWVKSKGIQAAAFFANRSGFRFKDIERAVLSMLPSTFPYVPGAKRLRCVDALAIARTNEMHDSRAPYVCIFSCLSYGSITLKLGRRKGIRSIFDHYSFTEDDGSPVSINSHNLRHYLNMLALNGGLTNIDIAIFSGRREVRQNRSYDHRTSENVQRPISDALRAGFTKELEPSSTRAVLLPRSSFPTIGLTAAHVTEYGWCTHDFASEPCPLHRDCTNCGEQVCIKGEAKKEKNLRLLKKETEYLLKKAKQALSLDEYNADAWVKHQKKTLERIDAMLRILENPSVEEGAHIKLDIGTPRLIGSEIRFIAARTKPGRAARRR